MDITQLLSAQRKFFQSGATLPVAFRKAQLKKLYRTICAYEDRIQEALHTDLGKSAYEGFMCESGLVRTEITHMLGHLHRYAREKTVPTPLAQFASRSYRKPTPYGNVLVMSPWNYPFLLSIDPLVSAIAAGNTVILKPSAYAPATAAVVSQIVAECFPEEYVAVITGGRKENEDLLKQKFDFIFFTGSQAVGKEVLRRAAEHLTPVVLELGGKSPCIVDASADLALAARRIVFGKFLNCGQTCVAPDYIFCHESIKEQLVAQLRTEIQRQFGASPLENPNYGKIINRKHFDRLCALAGGPECDGQALRIAPTLLENADWDCAAMQEEIFGPVLPILTFGDFSQVVPTLQPLAKPLALYLFSSDKGHIREVTERLQYGGGCINDVVIHLATSAMPFGGVGESGMGGYHGKAGFDAFCHHKSIVDKKTWLDLPMRYQPYTSKVYEALLKLFLR